MKFVLIPGAGGVAAYWEAVGRLLPAGAVAVDLPGSDESVGLNGYVERVIAAIGGDRDVVLVGSSLGAFTAAMVCARASVRGLALVNGMLPAPGETPGDWWKNTGHEAARREAARAGGYAEEFDLETYFLHDMPPAEVARVKATGRPQSKVVFRDKCEFERWPDVPTRVIAGTEDRFFPFSFQKRLARERMGRDVEPIRGGHLVALSNPTELARLLSELSAAC